MRSAAFIAGTLVLVVACGGVLEGGARSEERPGSSSPSDQPGVPSLPHDPPAPSSLDGGVIFEELFVSPYGSDENGTGSERAPYQSIEHAVKSLDARERRGTTPARISVCGERYSDSVSVRARIDREIVLAGGFDCATWRRNGRRLKLEGWTTTQSYEPTSDIAFGVMPGAAISVSIDSIAGEPITIEDMDVAMAFITSTPVVFRRSRIFASRGDDGGEGKGAIVPKTYAVAALAGVGGQATCERSWSYGGEPRDTRGGDAPGQSGIPAPSQGNPNGGIEGSRCVAGGDGSAGAAGADGADASPIDPLEVVRDERGQFFTPRDGASGVDGAPGQGGGAGAGASGGGGGAGGCGGRSFGGGAGAPSVAVFARNAQVRFIDSVIETGGGGNGGNGVLPQEGGLGEAGQQGTLLESGESSCSGGRGGKGGRSGASGGGAGGLSVGVFFLGTPPLLDDATRRATVLGPGGRRGAGGAPSNDGVDGVRALVLTCELPRTKGRGRCYVVP